MGCLSISSEVICPSVPVPRDTHNLSHRLASALAAGASTAGASEKKEDFPAELRTMGERGEVEIEGIQFPANLNSVTTLNFVLNQQEGKMTMKELQKAIDEQRLARELRKKEKGEPGEHDRNEDGIQGQPMDAISIIADEEKALVLTDEAQNDQSARQLREMVFLQVRCARSGRGGGEGKEKKTGGGRGRGLEREIE